MSSEEQPIGSKDPIKLRAASQVQQDLAVSCTLHSEIVWDVLAPDQADILKSKLEFMFPDDNTIYTSKIDLRSAKRHNAKVREIRAKLFQNIWQQRKFTNGALFHSIIYVIVTPELDMEVAKSSHNYTFHPIFRTRRCLNTKSSAGCCMIFIDEQSRIYQNWDDFVKNNVLPLGTMIAPAMGCYSLNDKNEVQLECSFTPAYLYQTITKVDYIVSAASIAGQLATMFHPACALLAIGTKTYETIRDYQRNSDKAEHGTATHLNANLNLTSNIISLTSSAVTFGAYMSVPTGESLSARGDMTIQAINSAATLISCTKLIVTTYDIFTKYFIDGEELEFTDLMAFGSSLILLTHSVNNMAIISQVGKVGGNTLRSLLQNNIKAGLNLISGQVIKYAGQNGGNYDLIRLVNDIPYKDVLRNAHSIFNGLTKLGFLTTLSVVGSGAIEVLPGLLVQVANKEITEFNFTELSKHYGTKFVKHIANSNNLIDILNGMGGYFSETIVQFLLNQTRSFIETTVDAIDSKQNTFISTEMVLYKMYSYALKNYKDYTYEFLESKKDVIIQGVTDYFQSFNTKSLNENNTKNNCDLCGGYYYLAHSGNWESRIN